MAENKRVLPDQSIPFVEYDLFNGLHVILAESHSVPLVAINLWYHVGSKDEDPARTGFAHLFEHLMFQGSEHVGKIEHFKYIQAAGGTLNATTNQDRTNYFETLPSSHLELGLWLESDRMLSLNISEENFENQRAVVKEERRKRYDNQPYGLVYETLLKYVYPSSGYHWSTIGSMEHLDETEIEEVVAFHRRYYVPNNASLAIVGDFKLEDARKYVERYFGAIPRGADPARNSQSIPKLFEQARPKLFDAGKLPSVSIAFQSNPAFTKEGYVFDVIASLLAAGKSSRLYHSLVYEKQIAKEITAYNIANESGGMLLLDATLRPGISVEIGERELWNEIERLKQTAVSDCELQKVQNRNESKTVRSLVSLAHRADHLQRAYTFTGNTARHNEALEMIPSVTAQDILETSKSRLRPEAAVVLIDLPKDALDY